MSFKSFVLCIIAQNIEPQNNPWWTSWLSLLDTLKKVRNFAILITEHKTDKDKTRIEGGVVARPSVQIVAKIAKLLGVPMEELFK